MFFFIKKEFLKKIICCIFLSLIFIACNKNQTHLYRNDEIDNSTRCTIDLIKKNIYKAFIIKDPRYLKSISSNRFLENQLLIYDTIFSNITIDKNKKIENFEDYNIVCNTNNGYTDFEDKKNNIHYYIPLVSSNNFVSFFFLYDVNLKIKWLVSCVFIREDNNWKIVNFYIGKYSFNNLNFEQYYHYVRKIEKNRNITDVMLNAEIGVDLETPSPIFKFSNSEQIKKYYEHIFDIAKSSYKFPFIKTVSKNNVEFYAVKAEYIEGSYYPLVFYKSNIDLFYLENLTKENDEINDSIIDIFPGINEIADTIVYKVTNSDFSHNYEGSNYGFVKKVKNNVYKNYNK